MKKAILTVLLVCLSATIAFAQNRPGAPIETVKKIRDARPSFKELVNEVDRLKQDLVKIEIAITEAKNSITVNNNSRLQDICPNGYSIYITTSKKYTLCKSIF